MIKFNSAGCKIRGIEANHTDKLAIYKDCRWKTLTVPTGFDTPFHEQFSTVVRIGMRNVTSSSQLFI